MSFYTRQSTIIGHWQTRQQRRLCHPNRLKHSFILRERTSLATLCIFNGWVRFLAFNRSNNIVRDEWNDLDQYRYREKWTGVLIRSVLAQPRSGPLHKGGVQSCELWSPFHYNVIMDIAKDLTDLEHIDVIRDRHLKMLEDCKYCLKRSEHWMHQIQREVRGLAFSDCWIAYL